MNQTLFRIPSAIIPLLMSSLALATVVIHLLSSPAAHPADEGTAAHVFQLLFAGQVPVVAFFAMKWLPREPARALFVMSLQAAAALIALAPVVFFNL